LSFSIACYTLHRVGLLDWLTLSLADGIGPVLTRRLIDRVNGDVAVAAAADAALLRTVAGIGPGKAAAIARGLADARRAAPREVDRAAKLGVAIVCFDDDAYPPLLREIPDPPGVLWVRGGFEPRDLNGVALVGSRKCSVYGREQADRFAAMLAGAGFTVISGGARGIDSAAHRAAIQHPQGRTIAVLGSGIDVVYPPENKDLFDRVAERGAVVSEHPPGSPPVAENFPRRNRIVSGMSRGVVVLEADERSGALITARRAIDDQGRPVFAVPGRVDNPLSAGPHKLIRDGALLVRGPQDVIDALEDEPLPQSVHETGDADDNEPADHGLFGATDGEVDEAEIEPADERPPEPAVIDKPPPTYTPLQQKLLGAIDDDTTVDQLVERTELDAATILRELTFLSLRGAVRKADRGYTRRSR
jgi:DNA processing protein